MFKIGLIGKMGAGKTTLADETIKTFGEGKRLSFADALKEDVIKYKLTADGTIDKKRDRSLLQNYGQLRRGELNKLVTDKITVHNWGDDCYLEIKDVSPELNRTRIESHWIGKCNPDYWVEQLLNKIGDSSVVVDDIRRLNEAKALVKVGFTIVKIECPDKERFTRLTERDGAFDTKTFNNISETEVDSIPYDFVVSNRQGKFRETTNEIYKEIVKM